MQGNEESTDPDLQSTPRSASLSKKTPPTRQSSTIFGLGNKITAEDSTITGSRLPTCLQVLRCLMHHLAEGVHENCTRWEAAKIVHSKVSVFYEKAHIPMITKRKACERLIKLLDDNAKVRAIPINRRSAPNSLNKLKKMEEMLAQTFPLWPANAEQLIKNPEDVAFLQSMKTDRLATFGPRDKVLAAKVQRREQRDYMEIRQRARIQSYLKSTSAPNILHDHDSSSSDEDAVSDEEAAGQFITPRTSRSHKRIARTGTPAFIPHDIIQRPKLVQLATRLKMTPVQQAAFTEALVAEAGGDTSKISTSYSTADKSRREIGRRIAESCKDQWIPPKLVSLHWDSKLMSSLSNQNITEERLTVVVGNATELKLLGVPSYQPGTDRKSGDIIADLTVGLLSSWQCTESVVNMTFDTTASNTGHVTAACVTVQKQLGRALLWSACRHHVGEIILSHVFDDLKIEASKSPDVTLFTRFRKNFQMLTVPSKSTDEKLSRLNLTSFNHEALQIVDTCRTSVLQLAKSEVLLRRDDYREFAELCTVFLDGETEDHPVTFKRPGALHKARWMAKLIYSIKICLFELQIQQLPRNTITTLHQVPKVRAFVNFATLVYSSWWMTSNSAVDTPWNDLQLYKSLLRYKVVNPDVSQSALHAFKLHLWYLTAEMIPLALWSSKVPDDERRALADSLLAVKPETALLAPQNRFGTGFGKPKFPATVTLTTTLADFASIDSWYTFTLLQLNAEFMTEKVANWPNSDAYHTSLCNLQSLNVVNDCAERGVKLSSDFLSSARKEEHYHNVLQVVEKDRKEKPNLRKRKGHSEFSD